MTFAAGLLRADGLSLAMFAMTLVIGAVILRYARAYLDGDPGRPRFVRTFVAILASVSVLVLSNHVLVLIAARFASSLGVHRLLTFYDRPRALLAAHKKFLFSRAADLCLLGAAGLIWAQYDTLFLDELFVAHGGAALTTGLQVATVLVALAALLQSAQLPVHGWLMQVMEAPTPVSALLHAGIVNVGGFLMIRFAPLMVDAELARGLLVVVGGATAAIASLVMLTRVSVKVTLAWSTCAQMGFMLVECGLGLWQLALLHLMAHSFYKAHAFLGSGGAVAASVARARAPQQTPPTPDQWSIAFGVVVAVSAVVLGQVGALSPDGLAIGVVLGGTVIVLLAEALATGSTRSLVQFVSWGALLVVAHGALANGFAVLLGSNAPAVVASWWSAGFVAVLFAAAIMLHAILRSEPGGALARRLYPSLYGGLFLDEWSTRFTLRVWPARWSRELREVPEPLPAPSKEAVST